MNANSRIMVAGGDTVLGAAIVRRLRAKGFCEVIDDPAGDEAVTDYRPEYLFLAAGKAAGIAANVRLPVDLMRNNLEAATRWLDAAHRLKVGRVLYLGSSCCYPKHAAQPMRVTDLWTGPLEPTSIAYAVAKLAGMELCRAYRRQFGYDWIVGIPTNYFGPGDHFDEDSHVIGSLVRRMHEARMADRGSVAVWGSGRQTREFLYADDLADACIHVMGRYSGETPINLAGGEELSIRELAEAIAKTVGYAGTIEFDSSRSEGAPRKALDPSQLIEIGFEPRKTPISTALAETYQWFLEHCQ